MIANRDSTKTRERRGRGVWAWWLLHVSDHNHVDNNNKRRDAATYLYLVAAHGSACSTWHKMKMHGRAISKRNGEVDVINGGRQSVSPYYCSPFTIITQYQYRPSLVAKRLASDARPNNSLDSELQCKPTCPVPLPSSLFCQLN